MSKTAVLIDGNSYAYRAFHGIRGLTTRAGQPTNAVYGFGKILLKIIRERQPGYLAVAFDSKGPTFRHKDYEKYKEDRQPMPDDLSSQFPLIYQLVEKLEIPIFKKSGYEADDFLATLSRELEAKGFDVFILTGDKDLLQLVNKKIRVISAHKEDVVYDEAKVKERWGVRPDQIVDVLALMGDAVDSIPGVPGIGEKTAIALVAEYGSLDEVMKKVETIGNTRAREALKNHKDSAVMSRSLATVKSDMSIELPSEPAWSVPKDLSGITSFCHELEMRSLEQDFSRLGPLNPSGDSSSASSELLVTPVGLEEWETALRRVLKGRLSVWAEFTEESPLYGRLAAVSVGWIGGEVARVVCESGPVAERVLTVLTEVWSRPGVTVVGHKVKAIVAFALLHKKPAPQLTGDVDIAEYLLEHRTHQKVAMEPLEILSVESDLRGDLEKKELLALYDQVELPLAGVLARMEARGIAVDDAMLGRQRHGLDQRLNKLQEDVWKLSGEPFNLNSPKQVGQVLFERLKLPHGRKGKTGYSTSVDILEELAKVHEVPKKLLEYRSLFKLKSGYLDALPTLKHAQTGRVHTSYNQTVAATGRLSSSDPNLQNIPIKTEEGREIRRAFVPGHKGWILVSADYSQIELRMLAHLSGDPVLTQAFERDEDIHSRTAMEVFGVKREALTPLHRRRAKVVNFGIIYGMGAFGLANELEISNQEAAEYIDAYFKRLPKVRAYFDDVVAGARASGYVSTILKRRRSLPDLMGANKMRREFAERAAMNAPLQGSAADLIKLAMIQVDGALRTRGMKAAILLQVHDELVLEAPREELETLTALLKTTMEGVYPLNVPLKVDVHHGANWAEAH